MASSQGNQIFVTLRKGANLPKTYECRIKYEQTIGDLKAAAAKKAGVPPAKLLLFWHGQEVTPAYDSRTLLDMNLHTGFSLMGYDLTEEPDFWPPVRKSAGGWLEVVPASE